MNWFKVQNGDQIDIHMIVVPEGEAPREITICSNVKPQHANLIEAAPNMYHALELCKSHLESTRHGIETDAYGAICAALTKANLDKEHQR